jgi:hypothetical protein
MGSVRVTEHVNEKVVPAILGPEEEIFTGLILELPNCTDDRK